MPLIVPEQVHGRRVVAVQVIADLRVRKAETAHDVGVYGPRPDDVLSPHSRLNFDLQDAGQGDRESRYFFLRFDVIYHFFINWITWVYRWGQLLVFQKVIPSLYTSSYQHIALSYIAFSA
jgi:hypothetical protein